MSTFRILLRMGFLAPCWEFSLETAKFAAGGYFPGEGFVAGPSADSRVYLGEIATTSDSYAVFQEVRDRRK